MPIRSSSHGVMPQARSQRSSLSSETGTDAIEFSLAFLRVVDEKGQRKGNWEFMYAQATQSGLQRQFEIPETQRPRGMRRKRSAAKRKFSEPPSSSLTKLTGDHRL